MYSVRFWTGQTTAKKEFFYFKSARAFARIMQRRCEVVDSSGKVITIFKAGREIVNNEQH